MGSGQNACAVCGAPLVAASTSAGTQRFVPDGETLRFARAVLSRPYIFTIAFLIANFFVFLLMWHSSEMSFEALISFREPVLIAYGAKVNSYINVQHQWWRFVTPLFIHVNLPHLLVNMYSLWVVGPYVEKLYGSAKFVCFWVATGIAGVFASYLTVRPGAQIGPIVRFILKTNDFPSAGASGALFGLVGVLFVFGIKYRHELPEGFKRAFGTGLLPMIALNLFIGFVGRGFIDNAAHLGGFIAGAALALVVDYRRQSERPEIAIGWRVLQGTALVLVAVSFLEVAQHIREPNERNSAFLAFARTMTEAQEAIEIAVKGDATGVDTANSLLQAAAPPDARADQLRGKLGALLRRAKELATPTQPKGEAKILSEQQKQLLADFESWKKEYEEWLKSVRTASG